MTSFSESALPDSLRSKLNPEMYSVAKCSVCPLFVNPGPPGQLGHIYALQGRRREALEVVDRLQQLSKQTYVDPRYIAAIYVALGEKDLAFVWLEKGYEEHSPAMGGLKTNWMYDPIRSDPRFAELVQRVGIP